MKDIRKDIEFRAVLRGQNLRFHSAWGLFSPEHIDEGTELLMNELEIKETDTCLDLGCGYGAIGLVMAKLAPQGNVHMVDKDFVAVEYAKKNAEANGLKNCEAYLSNGFSHIPQDAKFDVIASNLPAKPSKELYQIFFDDANKYLKPGGKFYVVVISGLKEFIKRSFKEEFGNCEKLKQGRAHCVFVAIK
ncbi:MAG TPA: methyltransferase [Candidatus Paceibacterota bacterium]